MKNKLSRLSELMQLLSKGLITQEEFGALNRKLSSQDIDKKKKKISELDSYLSEFILYFIVRHICSHFQTELFKQARKGLFYNDMINSLPKEKSISEYMSSKEIYKIIDETTGPKQLIFLKNIISSINLILEDLDKNQVKGKKEIIETLLLHQKIIEKFFHERKVPSKKILMNVDQSISKVESKIKLYWKGFDKNEDIFYANCDEIVNVWSNKEKIDSNEFFKIYNYFVDKYDLDKSYYFPFNE